MTMMTAEELLERLQSVLTDVQLTPMALRGIVQKYPNKTSIPFEQNTASMNGVLRDVGMDFSRPLRAELVICQIFLFTHDQPLFIRDVEDITKSFDFEQELVCSDPSLALFASYMEYAIMLVRAKGHMDFIINDVVAPLSENRSGRRFASGGGSESVSTAMRYKIFEQMTGLPRPKNIPMGSVSSERDQDIHKPHKLANTRPASATDVSVTSNEEDYPFQYHNSAIVAGAGTAQDEHREQFLLDDLPLHHTYPQPQLLLPGPAEMPWEALLGALLNDGPVQDVAQYTEDTGVAPLLDDGNDADASSSPRPN